MTRNPKLSTSASLLVAILLFAVLGGCRICAECDLDAYPSYGGLWQRTDREHGRVGSLFDPGGARSADLAPRTDPEDADARLRKPTDAKDPGTSDEEEGEIEKQYRENQEPRTESDEEKAQQEMEKRFKDLQLEDIKTRVTPRDETWN